MQVKYLIAIAMAMLWMSAATAQNPFQTGRPNYARAEIVPQQPYGRAPATNWNQPADVNSYNDTVGRPTSYVEPMAVAPTPAEFDPDYLRMQFAWENYRREAARYQQLHGGRSTLKEPVSSYAQAGQTQYPARSCRERFDDQQWSNSGDAADLRPRLTAPLFRQEPNRQGWAPNRTTVMPPPMTAIPGQSPMGPMTTSNGAMDLTKTTSRPIGDFFRWLVAAE